YCLWGFSVFRCFQIFIYILVCSICVLLISSWFVFGSCFAIPYLISSCLCSPMALSAFFMIVLLVFIAEVAGAVVILVFRPLADDLLEKVGTAAVKNIKKDYGNNDDITGLWNTTMETLNCCGFYNYTDFSSSPYHVAHNGSYPLQCCKSTSQCDAAEIVNGCFTKIKQLIDDNTVVIVAAALGIAALEICAMIVSMVLYCRIKSTRA
uniref:Tetraspanin 34b n=1 Tax=Fundulus heteroclitus TaxID=8078 RepID=A0A3Q2QIB2_FUNHE